jgi:hypothetical protein
VAVGVDPEAAVAALVVLAVEVVGAVEPVVVGNCYWTIKNSKFFFICLK